MIRDSLLNIPEIYALLALVGLQTIILVLVLVIGLIISARIKAVNRELRTQRALYEESPVQIPADFR